MQSNFSKKRKINHIAIIMDGNGRWAKKHLTSKKFGHESGIKNCIKLCQNLNKLDYKIDEISFYVFSTENWKRNSVEIHNLFKLIDKFYKKFEIAANENNLIIRHCGSKNKLSKKLIKIIETVTEKTKKNTGTYINLMFNYGSRQEVINAIKKSPKRIRNSQDLRRYLYIPDSSDPDLIIRTGGEKRLSNFMLWQSAYSELYFTKILWPDFKLYDLKKAIDNYFFRNRKYGE